MYDACGMESILQYILVIHSKIKVLGTGYVLCTMYTEKTVGSLLLQCGVNGP